MMRLGFMSAQATQPIGGRRCEHGAGGGKR